MNVAQTARVPLPPSLLRLNEKEREDKKATRIWVSGTWLGCEHKRYVEIITTSATREQILAAAKMAMVAKGKRERGRKDGGRGEGKEGGGGQVLLNENNSPLSSRLEERRIPPERHGGGMCSRRKLDRSSAQHEREERGQETSTGHASSCKVDLKTRTGEEGREKGGKTRRRARMHGHPLHPLLEQALVIRTETASSTGKRIFDKIHGTFVAVVVVVVP